MGAFRVWLAIFSALVMAICTPLACVAWFAQDNERMGHLLLWAPFIAGLIFLAVFFIP